jgi:HlyD family secretion protein
MKKTIVVSAVIIAAIVALILFNKLFGKKEKANIYAEVRKGTFEIVVANAGELLAEKSLDITGPLLGQADDHGGGGDHGSGGGRQGGGGGMMGGGGRSMDIRAMDFKIQDIVPEGTVVKQGDYIAQLDRSSYDNSLKDALETLTTYQNNVAMKVLDTAVALTNLRDEIKNQRYAVEEAQITLDQSKFEPPATIRQAEINLNKQQRSLDQKIKSYQLRKFQNVADIEHQKLHLVRQERLVADLQEFLTKFTITAPAAGMVIYKKDRMGNKRKAGSSLNPFDMVIATLPDLTAMISKVYVNEIEVSKVRPGQKVSITVDAFPQRAYTGGVISVANIGETLPNSDAKMFEVQIRLDGTDATLRPAMTTWNKIILKTMDDAVYIPLECVVTGTDSIPFVYKKNKTRQIVVLGEENDKNVIVRKGLEPGTNIYIVPPADAAKFRLVGEDFLASIKQGK